MNNFWQIDEIIIALTIGHWKWYNVDKEKGDRVPQMHKLFDNYAYGMLMEVLSGGDGFVVTNRICQTCGKCKSDLRHAMENCPGLGNKRVDNAAELIGDLICIEDININEQNKNRMPVVSLRELKKRSRRAFDQLRRIVEEYRKKLAASERDNYRGLEICLLEGSVVEKYFVIDKRYSGTYNCVNVRTKLTTKLNLEAEY